MTDSSAGVPGKPKSGLPSSIDWRLHKHADYQRVYKNSRKQFSARLAYFVAKQLHPAGAEGHCKVGARVGITAGRVLGKAVDRNRIKRRMRVAICAHFALLPMDVDVVLHPKRSVMDAPWVELDGEIRRIFLNIQKAARSGREARKHTGGESTGAPAGQPSTAEVQA